MGNVNVSVARRTFLKTAMFAAGGAPLAAVAGGPSFSSTETELSVPKDRVVKYFNGGWRMYMFSNRTIDIMLSTVFRSPSGRLVVVDGGWAKDGEFLHGVLRRFGGTVDAWFLTHAHGDHYRGLGAILKKPRCGGLKIGRVVHDFVPDDFIMATEKGCAPHVREFLSDLARSGLKVEKPVPGQVFDFGEGMSFECLNGYDLSMRRDAINNSSICYRVENGGKSVLDAHF